MLVKGQGLKVAMLDSHVSQSKAHWVQTEILQRFHIYFSVFVFFLCPDLKSQCFAMTASDQIGAFAGQTEPSSHDH